MSRKTTRTINDLKAGLHFFDGEIHCKFQMYASDTLNVYTIEMLHNDQLTNQI